MGGDVPEARNLLVLRREVHDRVRDEIRERERAVHSRRREVADRDADLLGAWLGPQLRDHRLRQVDSVHPHATPRERERDPAGPDAEFERVPAASEIGQERDDGIDDVGIRLVPVPLVEALRHAWPEMVFRHGAPPYSASTRTALTLYSGVPMSGSPTSCVSQFTFCSAKWSAIQTRPG